MWERNPDGMPSSQRSNFKREKMQNRSQEVTVALASCKPVSSTCLDRVRLLFDSDLSHRLLFPNFQQVLYTWLKMECQMCSVFKSCIFCISWDFPRLSNSLIGKSPGNTKNKFTLTIFSYFQKLVDAKNLVLPLVTSRRHARNLVWSEAFGDGSHILPGLDIVKS